MRLSWLIGLCPTLALCFGAMAVAPLAHALDPTRSIQDMHHRAFTQADGLPSGLTTIAQTPDGYLWVGSTGGLYRFDGVRFESVAADQLLGPSIIGLYATTTGDLWIGYDMGGGVSRMRDGKIEHFRSDAGGPAASVNNIRVSDDGQEIFTHGAYTVWRQHNGKWARLLEDYAISQIEMARGGVLWAKSSDQLFYCRPKGGECRAAPGYTGGVTGFARDREGRVWTSDTKASGRMYRLPDMASLPDTEVPGPEYGAATPSFIGARIFLDSDNTLWGVNNMNGLFRMRSVLADKGQPAQVDMFKAEDGLTNNQVSRIFEDREGSIWVSTKAGLDQFRPASVVLERSIPSAVSVAAYYGQAIGDSLYLQASTTPRNTGPLFRMSADGRIERLLDDIDAIWSVVQTNDGAIWLNAGGNLYRLDGTKLIALPPPPDSELKEPGTHVSGIVAGPENTLSAVLWINGAWKVSGGAWSRHQTMPADEELYRVELVRPGRDGAVWLSHYDPYKLFRQQDGRFRSFSDSDVKIGSISNVTVSGQLEYLSGEHGIAIFDGERFHTLGSDRAPALVSVRDVAATATDLWAVSQAGIVRFNREEAERAMRNPQAPAPRYDLFDQLDGLPAAFVLSSQSPAEDVILPRPDGRILFLTGAGVVWIDPQKIFRNKLAPPVVIRSLAVNGRTYDAPHDVALPAGSENLQIDYAALSFVEPSRVRFRYKLEGVDKEWVDPSNRRQAFYTRLEPGNYRFRVIAANDAGVWNEEGATLTFSIEPTFLQSIWFKLIVAAALLTLALVAYVWRLRWETARIRRQFEIRTAERERIARELHDTLLQGVQGLVLRVQSVTNTLPAGGDARGALEQTLDRADVVLKEGRARVRDLRIPGSNEGLPQLLVDAASAQITGEHPTFQLTIEGIQRSLLPVTQDEVLRIAEEAIRNAVRHAQANAIEVVVSYGRGELRVLVRDDGVGITAEIVSTGKRTGHYGLIGMNERAARIGGRLTINSREQSGADILLRVPSRMAYADGRSGLFGDIGRLWRRKRR